ncbi:hypothetical protein IFM89_034666 [Coptis chinensis]|uniref:Uncharacterized protein n=1 Tax=Coptis chinensis TaxID=261450 RepID=A0A835HRX3_9MAGN|nr:hypothetical protein IFM89_034666 [Coptis chinensis]
MEDDVGSSAFSLATMSIFPMVLRTVIELDLLEIISKAGSNAQLSPSQISSKLPTKNPTMTSMMLDRILRLLASYSMLTCTTTTLENGQVEWLYGLAPISKYFVKDQDGISISPFMMMNYDIYHETWNHLKDAVLDGGIVFNKAHGMTPFQYAKVNPRFNHVFNEAFFHLTSLMMKDLLSKYKGFKFFKEVTDVGGGTGASLSIITSKYPSVKGINFDLPHVIEHAPPYHGVQHVGGDMFESIPKSEAILLKWVLHNWNDECCLRLLKNCYKALPKHGKVIVIELISPTTNEVSDAAKCFFLCDLVMMINFGDSKERTEQEFEALAKEAGFSSVDVGCYAFNYWIIEFRK